ncbi:MAG: SpoVG family protein [Fibrobacterota bacterium]
MKTKFDLTEIRVYPFSNAKGKVKAFAHVVINGALRLTGLKVVEGENGLFLGYPSEKGKDGTYHSLCFPVDAEFRASIQEAVLANYAKAVALKS